MEKMTIRLEDIISYFQAIGHKEAARGFEELANQISEERRAGKEMCEQS
ncbi:hypothetical protein GNQ08_21385 [Paenibacillus macerans]|uniref:Uncharacterized protein n=1 Tax=Paenibacillus macerans TaxID=44252 RepID=A0A6N8F2Q2_PAEMA|nr:hypothetical protein [Paenibacillus macerans]MDU5945952.1 hypothetical protein [Paenibacillus macerans]MEC0329335.1 hypothetical protein [Paenibacillus macerans]MUG24921.1 hypothetical protein [Paenibacillus macerans]